MSPNVGLTNDNHHHLCLALFDATLPDHVWQSDISHFLSSLAFQLSHACAAISNVPFPQRLPFPSRHPTEFHPVQRFVPNWFLSLMDALQSIPPCMWTHCPNPCQTRPMAVAVPYQGWVFVPEVCLPWFCLLPALFIPSLAFPRHCSFRALSLASFVHPKHCS